MLEANDLNFATSRLSEIAEVLQPLSKDLPIHVELASMSNKDFVKDLKIKASLCNLNFLLGAFYHYDINSSHRVFERRRHKTKGNSKKTIKTYFPQQYLGNPQLL